MNDPTQALIAMFLAAVGIETWKELRLGHFPPRPFRFSGVAAVYALLALLAKASGPLAAVLGLGMLIALVVKMPSAASGGSTNPSGPVSV